uniref:F-box domain-containing protein n=1 Tax=Timema douglasi TaxID=61478 RepID=A0A7R8ZBC9_TIMDO|nr:unnamed protein product [Timema douglasi]
MESFSMLLRSIGVSPSWKESDESVDILGSLPEEVAILILKCVDSNSLVSAALVCKKWRNICRSDTSLRIAIRRQLRRDRLGPTALRTRDTNAQATRVRRNSDKEQIPVKIVTSFHSGRKQCARAGMFVDKASHTQTEKRGTFGLLSGSCPRTHLGVLDISGRNFQQVESLTTNQSSLTLNLVCSSILNREYAFKYHVFRCTLLTTFTISLFRQHQFPQGCRVRRAISASPDVVTYGMVKSCTFSMFFLNQYATPLFLIRSSNGHTVNLSLQSGMHPLVSARYSSVDLGTPWPMRVCSAYELRPILVIKDLEITKSILWKNANVFFDRSFSPDETLDPLGAKMLFGMKAVHSGLTTSRAMLAVHTGLTTSRAMLAVHSGLTTSRAMLAVHSGLTTSRALLAVHTVHSGLTTSCAMLAVHSGLTTSRAMLVVHSGLTTSCAMLAVHSGLTTSCAMLAVHSGFLPQVWAEYASIPQRIVLNLTWILVMRVIEVSSQMERRPIVITNTSFPQMLPPRQYADVIAAVRDHSHMRCVHLVYKTHWFWEPRRDIEDKVTARLGVVRSKSFLYGDEPLVDGPELDGVCGAIIADLDVPALVGLGGETIDDTLIIVFGPPPLHDEQFEVAPLGEQQLALASALWWEDISSHPASAPWWEDISSHPAGAPWWEDISSHPASAQGLGLNSVTKHAKLRQELKETYFKQVQILLNEKGIPTAIINTHNTYDVSRYMCPVRILQVLLYMDEGNRILLELEFKEKEMTRQPVSGLNFLWLVFTNIGEIDYELNNVTVNMRREMIVAHHDGHKNLLYEVYHIEKKTMALVVRLILEVDGQGEMITLSKSYVQRRSNLQGFEMLAYTIKCCPGWRVVSRRDGSDSASKGRIVLRDLYKGRDPASSVVEMRCQLSDLVDQEEDEGEELINRELSEACRQDDPSLEEKRAKLLEESSQLHAHLLFLLKSPKGEEKESDLREFEVQESLGGPDTVGPESEITRKGETVTNKPGTSLWTEGMPRRAIHLVAGQLDQSHRDEPVLESLADRMLAEGRSRLVFVLNLVRDWNVKFTEQMQPREISQYRVRRSEQICMSGTIPPNELGVIRPARPRMPPGGSQQRPQSGPLTREGVSAEVRRRPPSTTSQARKGTGDAILGKKFIGNLGLNIHFREEEVTSPFATEFVVPLEVIGDLGERAVSMVGDLTRVKSTILKEEFPDVVTSKVGCTDIMTHSIELNDPTPTGKIGRGIARLTSLRFEVVHIPGKDNCVVDGLSGMFEEDDIGATRKEIWDPVPLGILGQMPKIFSSIRLAQKKGSRSGKVERFRRDLENALIEYHHANHRNWDTNLTWLQLAFNTAEHASHGRTLFELLIGYEPLQPINLQWEIFSEDWDEKPAQLSVRRRAEALEHLKRAHETLSRRYIRGREPVPYKNPPYTLVIENNGSVQVKGLMGKVWSLLEDMMNFTTSVALVDESRFGFYLTMSEYTQEESSYNNFSHYTDVLLFDIPTNTYQGLNEFFYGIHIPLAIFTSESRVYIKHPGLVDKTPGKVSAPFEPSMWGAIVVAVLFLSATLALFQHGLSYREYIEKYLEQIEVIDDVYRGIPLVFLADGNTLWFSNVLRRLDGRRGGNRAYERGEKLEEIIGVRRLEVLNMIENSPTYARRAGASSNIDVTLCNQEANGIVKNWTAMISTLRTQRGDMTSCWKESARLLLETLLPDDNVEDDEEQETAKIDMTRNCDSKTETDPITREEMTRSKVVVLAGGKWNKISGRVPPQGVALTGARTNPGTIRFGSGGTPSGAGYCASSTPTQVATRFVFIITTLLAVIVFTAYSSNLISFLTVRKNVFTIKSIDEMFKKNSSYRVGVVKRSSEFDLLQYLEITRNVLSPGWLPVVTVHMVLAPQWAPIARMPDVLSPRISKPLLEVHVKDSFNIMQLLDQLRELALSSLLSGWLDSGDPKCIGQF